MHSRASQMETDAPREHQDTEVSQVKTFMCRTFARQLRICHSFRTAQGLQTWHELVKLVMIRCLPAARGFIWIKPWQHYLSYHLALFQALDTCQSDSKAAEEDLSSCRRLGNTKSAEHSSSEPQQRKNYTRRHFRQRSASDTTIATLHLSESHSPVSFHVDLLWWYVLFIQYILILKWFASLPYYCVCAWCRKDKCGL